jgi:hypothetical protein
MPAPLSSSPPSLLLPRRRCRCRPPHSLTLTGCAAAAYGQTYLRGERTGRHLHFRGYPCPPPVACGCTATNCGQIRLEGECMRRRTTPPPAAALQPEARSASGARVPAVATTSRSCLPPALPFPLLSLWALGGPSPLAMACFSDYEKGPDKAFLGQWLGTKHNLALPSGPASCHAWSGARGPCLAWPRARPDQAARMGIYTDRYPMLSRYMSVTEPTNYTKLSKKITIGADNLANLSPYNSVVCETTKDFKPTNIQTKIV